MTKDNFVKECHLLAEDAKLVSKDKNGNVMLPASFFGELSGILHELGIQTRGPYYIDEKHYKSDDGVSVVVECTELVRCKDCKYKESCCQNVITDPDWGLPEQIEYCSYGEREEADNERK